MILSGQVSSPAGGGITNFPTIEEVKANWPSITLTETALNSIPIESDVVLCLMPGYYDTLEGEEQANETFFIKIESSMQNFYWTSLYNDSNKIYYSTIGIDKTGGSIDFDKLIRVEDIEGNFNPSDTFMPKIYYTTADNFFSK